MNNSSKKQRVINEFCDKGILENYRDILSKIFDEIEGMGCQISSRYNENRSSHEFYIDGCHIRICLNEIYNESIHIIWTILHEFGHHLSGKHSSARINPVEKLEREELAWRIARDKALEYPALAANISNFDTYREFCLNTYRNRATEKK